MPSLSVGPSPREALDETDAETGKTGVRTSLLIGIPESRPHAEVDVLVLAFATAG